MIWLTLSCLMIAITVGGLFYIIEQNNKIQKNYKNTKKCI